MNKLIEIAITCKIWKDTRGQDMLEYALLAAFVACAFVTIAPGIAGDVVSIFGTVIGMLGIAGASDFGAPRS